VGQCQENNDHYHYWRGEERKKKSGKIPAKKPANTTSYITGKFIFFIILSFLKNKDQVENGLKKFLGFKNNSIFNNIQKCNQKGSLVIIKVLYNLQLLSVLLFNIKIDTQPHCF
jgi:hypothetical protein